MELHETAKIIQEGDKKLIQDIKDKKGILILMSDLSFEEKLTALEELEKEENDDK